MFQRHSEPQAKNPGPQNQPIYVGDRNQVWILRALSLALQDHSG